MFAELLGVGGGLVSSFMNASAEKSRFNKMMKHLREVRAWQKNLLAQGIGTIQGSKQAWQADPRRATERKAWGDLLENPSSMTPEAVSSIKANALSGVARDTADSSKRMAADAQRRGLGNSPYAARMQASLYGEAGRDYGDLAANIDIGAAKQRHEDKQRVLGGYSDWLSRDQQTEYGFSRDLAQMLGSVQVGNSAAFG